MQIQTKYKQSRETGLIMLEQTLDRSELHKLYAIRILLIKCYHFLFVDIRSVISDGISGAPPLVVVQRTSGLFTSSNVNFLSL
jgi:hypothetical protein